jgi:hypothetical protein
MYRFIHMTSKGSVIAECYRNFITAYRRCLPDVQDDYVIRLADATQTELNAPNNGEPIIVAWNSPEPGTIPNNYVYTASWIQRIDNSMVPIFPMLVMPQEIGSSGAAT